MVKSTNSFYNGFVNIESLVKMLTGGFQTNDLGVSSLVCVRVCVCNFPKHISDLCICPPHSGTCVSNDGCAPKVSVYR